MTNMHTERRSTRQSLVKHTWNHGGHHRGHHQGQPRPPAGRAAPEGLRVGKQVQQLLRNPVWTFSHSWNGVTRGPALQAPVHTRDT